MPAALGKVVFTCEFCGHRLVKRTSWLQHQYLRSDVYCCTNPVCNASFIGATELTHIASPSGLAEGRGSGLPEAPSYKRNAALAAHIARMTAASGDLFAGDDPPAPPSEQSR